MTTTEQWLARSVCSQGHALYGPADLFLHDSGECECAVCRRERLAANEVRYGTRRQLQTERMRVKTAFSRRWA